MSRPAMLKNNDIKSDVTSQITENPPEKSTSFRDICFRSQPSRWFFSPTPFETYDACQIGSWIPGPHLGDPAKLRHQVTFNQTSHQKWWVDAIIGQHQSLRRTVTNGIEACEVVKILQKKNAYAHTLKLTDSSHLKIDVFPKKETRKSSNYIHFQVRAVSFGEGEGISHSTNP